MMAERIRLPAPLVDPEARQERETLDIDILRPVAVPLPGLEDMADPELMGEIISPNPRGRPTEYSYKLDGMVMRMLMLGLPMKRIAEIIGVSPGTLKDWEARHPSFRLAIHNGRDGADANIVATLYHRAMGYSHHAEKVTITKDGDIFRAEYIEHYPPDTQALIFWLTNRTNHANMRGVKRMAWKQRQTEEVVDENDNPVDPTQPPRFIINAVTVAKPEKEDEK
jgi:hypothetical protein